jgi:AraC-like DNA-binding protein
MYSQLVVCSDIADFMAAPVGRCILGATYVVWCPTPDFQGALLWGSLDAQTMRELIQIDHFDGHPAIAPRRHSLIDCHQVTHVDADATLEYAEHARDRVHQWASTLQRQSIVVPTGLPGILIGGTLPSVGVAHHLKLTPDIESAFAHLDHPVARSSYDVATQIAYAARDRSVLLSRLASVLARDLSAPTVEQAATALGMSTRTLQRELARLDTSFSEELRRVRLATAESLLMHSDLKIDAIAHKVGLGNASRMSALLRRERSITAMELRARSRGA